MAWRNCSLCIQVIENEYGQVGIDEDLVKDKFKENEEIFGSPFLFLWLVALSD